MHGDESVSQLYSDGRLSWYITANDAPTDIGNQLPGIETLNTTLHVTGPGIEDAWGWAGPKLYPGTRVHFGYSDPSPGLPAFVLAQFDPALEALQVVTTRRTITVPAETMPIHFGLKFTALPLDEGEELVSVDSTVLAHPPLTHPPVGRGWMPLPD